MNAPALFQPLAPWAFGELRPHGYQLIVADYPWSFENYSAAGEAKGPRAHYRTDTPENLARRFPLGELADVDCLALVWATAPLLERQIAAVRTWGLELKSVIVWEKVFASGKPAIGTGYRVRSRAEFVLVATRGSPRHDPFPGLFRGIRREHSRKPDEFYEIIDRRCHGLTRRADLFARTRRPGWHAFGDELEKF